MAKTMRAIPVRVISGLVLKLVVSLFAVSLVVFAFTAAIPGDPGRALLEKTATPDQVAAFDQLHGLDRPVVTRYTDWLEGFVQGDWGTSYASPVPVADTIRPRLARTLVLATAGWLLAVMVAVPVGLFAGKRTGRRSDLLVSLVTLSVGALPEFAVGLVLALVFAGTLGWLPTDSSAVGLASQPWDAVSAYVLPSITLAILIIPYILRLTRANTREVVSEPYVRSAVLRGVAGRSLTMRHILPNAAPPVVNALALQFVGSIGGVVVTEAVFGFPGIGQLLVESVGTRDIPTVQAIALVIGAFFVVVNLIADLVVLLITPRLRTAAT
jgi:peptide/nickel transport system permease protein